MGATLDALHRLQNIETQLRSLRQQIESKRRSVQSRKRRLATLERQTADTRHQIQHAQSEADRLELERKTHEGHINKLREALNRAKTNKEYAAVLTQLNTDKANALRTEDTVLAALNRVDDLKKQEGDRQASLDLERARVGELERASTDLEARLSTQLADLEAQRREATDKIAPEALNFFERACEKHEGEAMAMIVQVHPKRGEYTCSGCHMSITLETINALQSRADAVRTCQTCSRVLYLDAPSDVTAGQSARS